MPGRTVAQAGRMTVRGSDDEMVVWEGSLGPRFFENIGVLPGASIVDFGCRRGHYALPAARVVGEAGLVCALDREVGHLVHVAKRASHGRLGNIRTVLADGKPGLPFGDAKVDILLLFDVLHMMMLERRARVYEEVARILKPSGKLWVHVQHLGTDPLAKAFKGFETEHVAREITRLARLEREGEYTGQLCHGDSVQVGRAMGFVRACER